MAYPTNTKFSKNPTRSASGSPIGQTVQVSKSKPPSEDGSWLKGLITLIIVLVIIGGGIYFIVGYTGIGSGLLPFASTFESEWQAVFLSNGQVYFGKVAKIDSDFLFLEDIYYLQVITLQDTIGQPPDVQTQPEQRLTLIKLGNEIHGPEDSMMINRDQIIIIEELKADSRVVQAINDYLDNI